MRTFFVRFFVIGAPFWLLLLIYFVCDPFRIIYQYDGFYKNNHVGVNREFASTELFLKKHKTLGYNSFIFGSSRSLSFYPESWAKHLGPSASPYIFDVSGESIFGIHAKVKLIDQMGVKLDNALIILDCDQTFLSTSPNLGSIIGTTHPIYAGNNYGEFQLAGLKSFLKLPFWTSYLADKWLNLELPYSKDYIERRPLFVSDTTNILIIPHRENEINNDTENYYKKRESIFKERETLPKILPPVSINAAGLKLIQEIRKVFDKNRTHYEVVIGPAYSQQTFTASDMEKLHNTFGKEHVHDFSGVNEITNNKYNYYEKSHFRPHVADSIMRYIYKEK